jgi:hypothetical protein
MTEKDTMDFKSLDNSNKLFMPSPMCVLYLDGDNIRIMSLAKNEAKIFNKNDKTNILNFVNKYKPRDQIESGGICILYEIIPQEKYLFYWVDGIFVKENPEIIVENLARQGFQSKIEIVENLRVYPKSIIYNKDGKEKILFLPQCNGEEIKNIKSEIGKYKTL